MEPSRVCFIPVVADSDYFDDDQDPDTDPN
jgi:hypothetical protein